MTAPQRFLVLRPTDPVGADWDPDADGARSTAHIGRMHVIPAGGD